MQTPNLRLPTQAPNHLLDMPPGSGTLTMESAVGCRALVLWRQVPGGPEGAGISGHGVGHLGPCSHPPTGVSVAGICSGPAVLGLKWGYSLLEEV